MSKLKRVSLYRSTDRRCYNEAFCSGMERELASLRDVKEYLKSLGLRVTYFPAGEFYVGFDNDHNILTEDMKSFEECANAAIEYLENLDTAKSTETVKANDANES